MLRKYKDGAERRGLVWELSDVKFDVLVTSPCAWCGAPPGNVQRSSTGDFTYSGIDRLDNSIGSIWWNVVPCCWTCNNKKSDDPLEQWLAWLERIGAPMPETIKLAMKNLVNNKTGFFAGLLSEKAQCLAQHLRPTAPRSITLPQRPRTYSAYACSTPRRRQPR